MPAALHTSGTGHSRATKAASSWSFTFMTPLNKLVLIVEADGQSEPLFFQVRRVVNAGYVGRNRQAVEAHIEELRREGIPPPASVPALYPLSADNVTTAEEIEVLGHDTSGEVE